MLFCNDAAQPLVAEDRCVVMPAAGNGIDRCLLNRDRRILIRFLAHAENDDVLTVALPFPGFVMDGPNVDTLTADAFYQ